MVEMLIKELASIGLHVNGKKTKIITNASPSYNYFDISGELVTVLGNNEAHRYLGRLLCGNLSDRAATEIKNRLQNSWYKFSQYSRTLTNRNISIKLRLKLFDSVITPSILFGLAALPVTQAHLDKVDATQRKMIRKCWVGQKSRRALEHHDATNERPGIKRNQPIHNQILEPTNVQSAMEIHPTTEITAGQ